LEQYIKENLCEKNKFEENYFKKEYFNFSSFQETSIYKIKTQIENIIPLQFNINQQSSLFIKPNKIPEIDTLENDNYSCIKILFREKSSKIATSLDSLFFPNPQSNLFIENYLDLDILKNDDSELLLYPCILYNDILYEWNENFQLCIPKFIETNVFFILKLEISIYFTNQIYQRC
jgi:hypothetical protein